VACLAVCLADAGEFGQLERDVFDDVSEVSSFVESGYKATGSSETTMMSFDSGEQYADPDASAGLDYSCRHSDR
jgi:hypothetical protein